MFLSSLGFFIFVNPAQPHTASDNAIIKSPVFDAAPNGDCVKFWYYLDGPDDISLKLWLLSTGPVWTKNGPQGNFWRYGYATVTSPTQNQVNRSKEAQGTG